MVEEILIYKMDYKELEALIKEYLGITDNNYNFVGDMGNKDSRWANDTVHWLDVDPESHWLQPLHDEHIADVKHKGKVEYSWELHAVMNELGKAGKLAIGTYIVDVCW